ncbi:mannan-binding lectin [Devosia ginsengisoli]|uniref:mannan-binding lectin n=1 Tax=Devosia ginsengisoli TaxID=400770 RepID=UPI0026ECA132|nr:mannan-binding lectin [Devosia ginsengisoli]MCR6672843.1 mannan-binding lectin [Devosia ginsengisoli]
MAPLAGATAARQLEEELPSKISVRYPLWAIVGLVFALIAGASISTPALAQSAASNQKAAVQAQQALEQAGTASTQAGTASTLAGDLLQQQLAAPQQAASFVVEAGPIWSTNDANRICPALCTGKGGSFSTSWWTTVPGKMSVCQCKSN